MNAVNVIGDPAKLHPVDDEVKVKSKGETIEIDEVIASLGGLLESLTVTL